MRVSTLFNRILELPGVRVVEAHVEPAGVVVVVVPRKRHLQCPCGRTSPGRYDVSTRRWRHLDLAGAKLFIQMQVRRLRCGDCGRVRTEDVRFARPLARHTRAFEQLVAWCAQRMDKTAVSELLRCGWRTVDRIIARVVAETLGRDRFDDLRRIGVDEVSYRKHHRYLTVVVDHDHGGRIIWAGEGRKAATLGRFFAELGPERAAQLQAITLDMSPAYLAAAEHHAPQAAACVDPFHVISLANRAVDHVRRRVDRHRPSGRTQAGRTVRWALLKDPGMLTSTEEQVLEELRRARSELYEAWVLKEDLRGLYALEDRSDAEVYLHRWCMRAEDSGVAPMANLARTLRLHHAGIVAAVELGLSNSRLEGMNSKIRLLNHRGYGHHSAAALIAVIYLACSRLALAPPHR